MIQLQRQSGDITIYGTVVWMGDDLCVCVYGGDKPHIGAVSLTGAGMCNTCVLNRHKEQLITEPMAQSLSEALDVTVAVVCGIHFYHFTTELGDTVLTLCKQLTTDIIEAIGR